MDVLVCHQVNEFCQGLVSSQHVTEISPPCDLHERLSTMGHLVLPLGVVIRKSFLVYDYRQRDRDSILLYRGAAHIFSGADKEEIT